MSFCASALPLRQRPLTGRTVVTVVALSQLVLGVLFLAAPHVMYGAMGLPQSAPGFNYVSAMLAARLLAYGLILLRISHDLPRHRLWLDGMMMIQAIDLAAGLFYSSLGDVAWASSAFPMINATLFLLGLALVRPKAS